VEAGGDEAGVGFEEAGEADCGGEEGVGLLRGRQVENCDGGAFNAESFDVGQARGCKLGGQLVGVVEVGVGEAVRSAVAPAGLERFDALALDGFGEPSTAPVLEQAGVPVDACGNYQAAGSGDAGGSTISPSCAAEIPGTSRFGRVTLRAWLT
jgi:hypothetical protein